MPINHTHMLYIYDVCVLSHLGCIRLFATLWTVGVSVHGILQARVLDWVPFPPPGDLPDPGIKPASPTLADRFFTPSITCEALTLTVHLRFSEVNVFYENYP